MNQFDREAEMFELGTKRLERQVNESNTRNYGSSGPVVRRLSLDMIKAFARSIKVHVEDRLKTGLTSKGDHCLASLVGMYAGLEPDGGSFEKPDYAYMLISTTVWKPLADAALMPDPSRRVDLKTNIGHLLELQFKVKFYEQLRNRLNLDDPQNRLLADHLEHLRNLVQDNGATLSRRMGRAKGLYAEIDRGDAVVRRGRKTKGAQLFIPKNERFQPWEDPFREYAAIELLDLLCVPKGAPVGDDDPRPFQITKNKKVRGGDLLEIREPFRRACQALFEVLQGCTVDFLPLIEKPIDWVYLSDIPGTDNRLGGFHTEGVRSLRQCALVRFGQGQNETTPSQLGIDFLNKLQSTPWLLDQPQSDIVHEIGTSWEHDFDGIARPLPFTTQDMKRSLGAAALLPDIQYRDSNRDQYTELTRRLKAGQTLHTAELQFMCNFEENNIRLRELYRKTENSIQNCKAFALVMARFERIKEDPELYFVWNFDSRQRTYCVGGYGHPQSGPSSRYTLTFKNGERLSPDGERSALRAIGTAMVDSKVSIDKRIQHAVDNLDLVRAIAEGTPAAIALAEGSDHDSPLELIALSRNWVNHENGEAWHAPVYGDAVCSGYQIVSGLINNIGGLTATNIVPMTTAQTPNDAYRISLDTAVGWLRDPLHVIELKDPQTKRKRDMTTSERQLLVGILTIKGGKLGRKISKAYARTSVYGSGAWTQSSDIQTELFKGGVSDNDVPGFLRMALRQQIKKAFDLNLGPIGKYHEGIKRMAMKRLFTGVEPEVKAEFERLDAMRSRCLDKNRELPNALLGDYLEVCRAIYRQSKHGLNFVLPDGSFIDERQYVMSREEFKTTFHGSPTVPVTHIDCLSPTDMRKAIAPDVIHSIDGLILRYAYADAPYDLTCIHDAAGCHPNNFDDLCLRYRKGFLKATEWNFLQDLADQWETELLVEVGSDTSWRDGVLNATNMFN